MRGRLLIDTGPLVSFLDRRDSNHKWTVDRFRELHSGFLTCEPVLAEVCFLIRHNPSVVEKITKWIDRGFLEIGFDLQKHFRLVFGLMRKYRDLPMSLADACLVAMVEEGIGERVFTLDSHFRVYCHSGRKVVPVLMPE